MFSLVLGKCFKFNILLQLVDYGKIHFLNKIGFKVDFVILRKLILATKTAKEYILICKYNTKCFYEKIFLRFKSKKRFGIFHLPD
ncbi:hypothetical protein FF38_12019 [Lucilia cuprina]|uniref:Uncharacterized protein n=1 Tax=Lucilia cuprina TaxID=7375 RepID=A0A0L0CFD8_LUCCU|nr:hypothetical protein FF38_12019 [Lucilia cuprina]